MSETPTLRDSVPFTLISPLVIGCGAIFAVMGVHAGLAELDIVELPENMTPEKGFGTTSQTMLLGALGLWMVWYAQKPFIDGVRWIRESCARTH